MSKSGREKIDRGQRESMDKKERPLYLLVPLGEIGILLVLNTDLGSTLDHGGLLLGLGGHLVDLGDLRGLDLGGSRLGGASNLGGSGNRGRFFRSYCPTRESMW